MGKGELTKKQKRVLEFIQEYIRENNRPPTIREIAMQMNFKSTGIEREVFY